MTDHLKHTYDPGTDGIICAATLADAAADPALTLEGAREMLRDAAEAIRCLHQYREREKSMTDHIEALRTEVERVTCELMDATARAERLAEALRGWWKMRRPVGWTEDQHRSCPHVNLATDAEKALATALLREQEQSHDP